MNKPLASKKGRAFETAKQEARAEADPIEGTTADRGIESLKQFSSTPKGQVETRIAQPSEANWTASKVPGKRAAQDAREDAQKQAERDRAKFAKDGTSSEVCWRHTAWLISRQSNPWQKGHVAMRAGPHSILPSR